MLAVVHVGSFGGVDWILLSRKNQLLEDLFSTGLSNLRTPQCCGPMITAISWAS